MHGEKSLFPDGKFGGDDGSEGKPFSVFRLMGDTYRIHGTVVDDGVCTGYFSFASGGDMNTVIGDRHIFAPRMFRIELADNIFGQSNSSPAGVIEFMNVVYLFYFYRLWGEMVHDTCQIFVNGKEDINSQTEIRGIEKSLAFLAGLAYFR